MHRRASEFTPNGLFVKICGITTEEDALLSVAMGADALGFNFVPGSSRLISPTVAADIVRRIPPDVAAIGIFRNELPSRVIEIVQTCGLTGAQLHGHESAEDCATVARSVGFTIQAFAAGDRRIDRASQYPVEVVMIDNPKPGSGEVFDWTLAEVPNGKRLLLAGGLNPQNVGDAVREVRPWGVDVATGVESSPGRKDPRKVKAFISAARASYVRPADEDDGFVANSGAAPYDWQDD